MPSWEALNAYLYERCVGEDARPASGRGDTIGALGQEERAHLFPLQRHGYPCCRTRAARATRQSLVTFERNRYSVPTRYEGQRLLLRAFPWEVEISDGQTVVARHPRLYGRDGEQLDPLHYLALLERKSARSTWRAPSSSGPRSGRRSTGPTSTRSGRPVPRRRGARSCASCNSTRATRQPCSPPRWSGPTGCAAGPLMASSNSSTRSLTRRRWRQRSTW